MLTFLEKPWKYGSEYREFRNLRMINEVIEQGLEELNA